MSPSNSIDFRILGSLSVTVDGVSVGLGGPRQMAVLARLMLTPGQVVSMDQLVDSVWDGDEPAQPNVAIRSYVSNLRRAVEPLRRRRASDSILASVPPGYRLAVDPSAVDWIRFERLVEDGRARLSGGEPEAAIERLRRADALWRGEPCAGVPESQTFLAHRGRMTKAREAAVELLYEAMLLRGDHAFVVNEIDAAIAEHPLRERLTELGMIAFYRAGRQSEALGLGQKLRTRLREGLGIDPSPAIEALELKILNHDRSLDPSTAPPLQPERRRPDSVGGPLRLAIAPGAAPGSVAATPVGPELLDQSLQPVGRDRELAELDKILPTLDAGRSVTAVITGEQGIGKTTLVEAAADRLVDRGVEVIRARSLKAGAGPLWPWAQLVLTMIERLRSEVDFEVTADLYPLAALGPSVAGALGIPPMPLLDVDESSQTDAETAPPADGPPIVGGETADDNGSLDDGSLDDGSPDDGSLDDGWVDEGSLDGGVSVDGGPMFPAAPVELAEVTMACVRLVERTARRGPLVLVLEDLQWTDKATAASLNFANRTLADKPVCFLLTWRNLDIGFETTATRLRELAGLPRLIRIDLDGFDAGAVAALAARTGQEAAPEPAEVLRRSGGNPLFVRELLTEAQHQPAGPLRSSLVDAVRDRVEQIHPMARSILTVGALFRRPFSSVALQSVSGVERQTIDDIVGLAVRSGVLADGGSTAGTYAFCHPVVAEVLASQLLAAERSTLHRLAGHHLLASKLSSQEAAFHLAESPEREDRLLAARLTMQDLRSNFDGALLSEIERIVFAGFGPTDVGRSLSQSPTPPSWWGQMLARAGGMAERAEDPLDRILGVDVLGFLSWKAWLDGRPGEWLEAGRQALDRALELSEFSAHPSVRTVDGKSDATRATTTASDLADRLANAALNLVGASVLPTGPTRTMSFAPLPESVIDTLRATIEVLGDHPARPVIQVHLAHRDSLGRPGPAARSRAVKDAQKQVAAARRKLGRSAAAEVQMIAIARNCDDMDPTARLEAVDGIEQVQSDIRSRIFTTRYAYPALLELGKTYDAERRVERLLGEAEDRADPIQLAEAHLLWIRHLLWTGQLDQASSRLQTALDAWTSLGIDEPVPFVRQRRTVRLLRGVPLGSGHGPDSHDQLHTDRVSAPERAMRLARLGDGKRAAECLESTLDVMTVRHLGLADQALTAMAAAMLGHEKAAVAVHELLQEVGDRPVVRPDGSVILGPASLYAGLAAEAAGKLEQAAAHVGDARRAVQRFGGSPASLELMIRQARPRRTAVVARSSRTGL